MKRIEELWEELEAELASSLFATPSGGNLTRLATPDSGQRLRVGIELPSKVRLLLFSADTVALPPRAAWPECRGLELLIDHGTLGKSTLVIRLRDPRGKDVFTALAEDLAKKAVGGTEADAARRVIAGLARWQRFLASIGRSLSDEARRGLWGELKILEDIIMPCVGIEVAMIAWKGPFGVAQDFQLTDVALEVKTRAAKSPAVVRISSERQLHAEPWKHLILIQVAVDEQDGAGETLPDRISKLRKQVHGHAAAEIFEDALIEACWLDAEEEKHRLRGFVLREVEMFRVEGDFSRLTPPDLPQGIGGVVYDLSLDAVAGHAVLREAVEEILKQSEQ
ncbi:MAG: hypothetical protein B9S37_04465 [Verrucomicrobiia bacterium Tous-C3TDCM]|nr:MAG: hypothetical protein B9S37_04465 [Verrucomicrobiae bacterium Tous-C3TDCM]PAZ06787.1 MAG: hypothetical protein CAK88_02495 [Verrucomicrobiae bacterium AMD-G2]